MIKFDGGEYHINPYDVDGINNLSTIIYSNNVEAGWYSDPKTGRRIERNVGEMFSLLHSEVSEAFEGYRKSAQDDHLPHRKAVEVELADVLIRLLDTAGYLNLDLGGAMKEKFDYNKTRSDHKMSERAKAGGKKI